MSIDDLVVMAKTIHDVERWDLGARSTRDTRNAFWARVVGCAYHGHPAYNLTPDRQWHLKNGGGGRPQSDDVVVSMPSRQYWDCIGGAGADGYTFRPGAHAEPLPMEQEVYAPPVPSGAQPGPSPTPIPPPPAPECRYQPCDIDPLLAELVGLRASLYEARAELAALRLEVQDVRATLRNGLAIEGKGTGLRWVGEQSITGVAKG